MLRVTAAKAGALPGTAKEPESEGMVTQPGVLSAKALATGTFARGVMSGHHGDDRDQIRA